MVTPIDAQQVTRRQPFGDNPSVGKRGTSTQRSILHAALRVFDRHGFHGARVELITEAAGCSRPTFYQYFSSKEDVFWHLAGILAKELRAVVDGLEPLRADPEGVEALERWLGELIDLFQAYRPVFASFREAFREDGRSESLPDTITVHLRDLIQNEGVLRDAPAEGVDLEVLAEFVTATLLRTIHHWALGMAPGPTIRFTRGVASTVHRVAFGPIDGVNTGPLVEPPAQRRPPIPTTTSDERRRRARGVLTRQRLLDAAGQVLAARGYHETRIDDIVAAAGLSHGSFYRYFQNKEQLFGVLAVDAAAQMVDCVERFPVDPDDADRELRSWLTEWFDAYRARGGVLNAWEEIGPDAPLEVGRSTEVTGMLVDRLEQVVRRRGFGDVSVDALVLLAVIEHGPHSVWGLGRFEEPEAIAAVAYIIRRGVLGLAGPT